MGHRFRDRCIARLIADPEPTAADSEGRGEKDDSENRETRQHPSRRFKARRFSVTAESAAASVTRDPDIGVRDRSSITSPRKSSATGLGLSLFMKTPLRSDTPN